VSQDFGKKNDRLERSTDSVPSCVVPEIAVSLLTGGADRPYAFGLATALMSCGTAIELIGNDDLESPHFRGKPGVRFLNFRGDQSPEARFVQKLCRVLVYYVRLIRYAAIAKPTLFHILWNNRFEMFDRTLLMLYYKLLGKQVLLTAHNVNASKRDSNDSFLNRLTLWFQYRLANHVFVHTEKMKLELSRELDVDKSRITVIPFGINNSVPHTELTPGEAKRRLGIGGSEKTILFFGNIAPYKGLEYLISAFRRISEGRNDYRLIIAGRPKDCDAYWRPIQQDLILEIQNGRVLLKADYILDNETEIYFKAADLFALPYRHIYQSGVLFLGQSFGLPVVATDVGSLKDEIVEGRTGFMCRPEDPVDLANAIERYFASDLYRELNSRRKDIREYAEAHHSWGEVAQITTRVYAGLLRLSLPGSSVAESRSSLDIGTSL
jgi:glycosyltransferase involved in cell wall biosynthesis